MHSKKLFVYVLIFSVSSILCFLLATYLLNSLYVVDVQQKNIEFSVVDGNHVGFNLNTSALIFGRVPRGGGSEKRTTLVSQIPTVAKIRIDPVELSNMIIPSSNNVYVNESGTQVTFVLDVPLNATVGNYTGMVTIVYLRKMPWN